MNLKKNMESLKDTENVPVASAVKIYSDVGVFVTGMTYEWSKAIC